MAPKSMENLAQGSIKWYQGSIKRLKITSDQVVQSQSIESATDRHISQVW